MVNYRPISLIGCLYKIVAKILANCLNDIIGSIVDKVQSSYVKDKNILDGPLVMNEIFTWDKKVKKPKFLLGENGELRYIVVFLLQEPHS